MNSDTYHHQEQKLGFDLVRQMLADGCLSPLGKGWVGRMNFMTAGEEVSEALAQTAEMKDILQFEEHFPQQDYYDMISELLRIRIPGTYPEPEQVSELRLSLETISAILEFLDTRKEKFPAMMAMMAGMLSDPAWLVDTIGFIHAAIDRIIDEKTNVRDHASAELARIRKEKSRLQSSVESRIMQAFRTARQHGWTPDDAEVTLRNGRLVIPMVNTHKRKIQGFVHDESATGQTVYVEPAEIFETNNEIRELDYAERREIIRILVEFAGVVRPHVDEFIRAYTFLGRIDFLRSKALFAISIHAVIPLHAPVTDHGTLSLTWHNAIHPLLFLSHQKLGRKTVPLDIRLDHQHRILIISGPNAGGKSVCLKTVGLVQYMYQCGLLPPVRQDSEFCLFDRILIDIGDEQSIDNDLSTYSSKLINLKRFLSQSDAGTLFLIDEMGTGTDPVLGGAIAEATLEALNAREAMGVVTTHYSNLKLLASRQTGFVNGAMLYDLKQLKPLYRLTIGKPGSSFALEIAREIGFPEEVLDHARRLTGRSQLDFDRELQNLEVEKQEINQKSSELRVADEFLAELIQKYEKLSADLELRKKEILDKARNEARSLLDNSNRIIERTIREIREAQAEKERTKQARSLLEAEKNRILAEKPQKTIAKEPEKLISKDLVGSQAPPHRFQKYFDDLNDRISNFSLTLDLRGFRADDAVPALQRYIDDAILFSIAEVRILHGKGNGVLRQITRDYLRAQKEVRSAKDAPVESGGAGITIVTFR